MLKNDVRLAAHQTNISVQSRKSSVLKMVKKFLPGLYPVIGRSDLDGLLSKRMGSDSSCVFGIPSVTANSNCDEMEGCA